MWTVAVIWMKYCWKRHKNHSINQQSVSITVNTAFINQAHYSGTWNINKHRSNGKYDLFICKADYTLNFQNSLKLRTYRTIVIAVHRQILFIEVINNYMYINAMIIYWTFCNNKTQEHAKTYIKTILKNCLNIWADFIQKVNKALKNMQFT